MIKEHTPIEWDIYGKVLQTKELSVREFAERNNISAEEVLRVIAMWKQDHPELFAGYDTEKESMRGHVNLSRRKKENIEVTSYDSAVKDGENACDTGIRQKF